jgi:hypothetical protein
MGGVEANLLKFVIPLLKTLSHKLLSTKEKLKLNPKTPAQ